MKKYVYLFSAAMLMMFIASCSDETDNPADGGSNNRGSVFLTSSPEGAEIWISGNNTSQVTPDTITGLSPGIQNITLRLEGYRDTTVSVNVITGVVTSDTVNLTSDMTFETFTDTIWETSGTNSSMPSGIDLSTGMAVSTSSAEHDIFYSSNGYIITTSPTRSTVFYVGSGSDLADTTDSPLAQNAGTGGWASNVTDREQNYFFLFDQDLHYSKMRIVSFGGGTPETPAWVIVQWRYNTKANDVRF